MHPVQDLYSYAGYSVRSRLIRGCTVYDPDSASPTFGQKASSHSELPRSLVHGPRNCHFFPRIESLSSHLWKQSRLDGELRACPFNGPSTFVMVFRLCQ